MSWEHDYFSRIRPAVGDLFRNKRIFYWHADHFSRIAKALAQSGIRSQIFASHQKEIVQELIRSITTHNHFEKDWDLAIVDKNIAALRNAIHLKKISLFIVELDDDAPEILDLASEYQIPALFVLGTSNQESSTQIAIYQPGNEQNNENLKHYFRAMRTCDRLNPKDLDHRLDFLETQSLTLTLSRWLLAKGLPPRPVLKEMIAKGKNLILRGSTTWPWQVRWIAPHDIRSDITHYRPPRSLFAHKKILIIGLGTASLFAREALPFFEEFALIDYKTVSVYNPVRQLYPTMMIDRFKGDALKELLQKEASKQGLKRKIIAKKLFVSYRNKAALREFEDFIDYFSPDLAIVAMGRSKDDNFLVCEALRKRGIKHITPTAFAGVSHFKHIVTDGKIGPCYDCLQGHLAIDRGQGPTLNEEERDLFYGGTQPATLAETLPSAYSLLRLSLDLMLPNAAKPVYLRRELSDERNVFVGANRVEKNNAGWLYGIEKPFHMVTFGVEDIIGSRNEEQCPCGRMNIKQL